MKILTHLPDSFVDKGVTFERFIGLSKQDAIADCKANKLRYRVVKVLPKNLRGKTDLHNQPYKPTVWVFREKK